MLPIRQFGVPIIITGAKVATLPRQEPETVACEPETVNRRSLQVPKSLEASPPLKNWR
jgi:hypothetical protein